MVFTAIVYSTSVLVPSFGEHGKVLSLYATQTATAAAGGESTVYFMINAERQLASLMRGTNVRIKSVKIFGNVLAGAVQLRGVIFDGVRYVAYSDTVIITDGDVAELSFSDMVHTINWPGVEVSSLGFLTVQTVPVFTITDAIIAYIELEVVS